MAIEAWPRSAWTSASVAPLASHPSAAHVESAGRAGGEALEEGRACGAVEMVFDLGSHHDRLSLVIQVSCIVRVECIYCGVDCAGGVRGGVGGVRRHGGELVVQGIDAHRVVLVEALDIGVAIRVDL